MQSLSPHDLAPTPLRPAPALRNAEFQFSSDAALARALRLALEQPWIGSCTVDRSRRTLRVTLAAGTPGCAAPRSSEASATLH